MCVCVSVLVVGGRVTVADRWPFLSLSDHVEHCLERSSEQKMDFISVCITGFKVQQALCNLRALYYFALIEVEFLKSLFLFEAKWR